MTTSPLNMERSEIEAIVLPECVRQLRDRQAEYKRDEIEAFANGFRPSHCIHGTRMVYADDRDAICGWCEDSLSLDEEAVLMCRRFVDDFVEVQASFKSAISIAIQNRMPSDVYYPMVAWLANTAIDHLQPVWHLKMERWVPHLPVAGQAVATITVEEAGTYTLTYPDGRRVTIGDADDRYTDLAWVVDGEREKHDA